ncbi:winged helix DNA-binding domain-containing protein [bacterium]|nr:MAG: winged helix DNA-binding domain-containing protein [bacterium]
MNNRELLLNRLSNQQIANPSLNTPAEVVTHLGAFQAQDYEGALWSIGLRLPGSTRADIVRAIENREIVRTWPMRGTLHFVPARDMRWMLRLTATKVIKATAARYRQLELDDEIFGKARQLLTAALEGDKQFSRIALFTLLKKAGIAPEGQRGVHILGRLCMEGLLCQGAYAGKEPTFALLEEWVINHANLSGEEALAELTKRYFTSHGPTTIEDFAWWSGLTKTQVKAGLAANSSIESFDCEGKTYWKCSDSLNVFPTKPRVDLLPSFDEYMLGYSDRSAAIDTEHHPKIVPGNNGMFMATIVVNGKIEGLWKRSLASKKLKVSLGPFASLTTVQLALLQKRATAYGQFLGYETTELQL